MAISHHAWFDGRESIENDDDGRSTDLTYDKVTEYRHLVAGGNARMLPDGQYILRPPYPANHTVNDRRSDGQPLNQQNYAHNTQARHGSETHNHCQGSSSTGGFVWNGASTPAAPNSEMVTPVFDWQTTVASVNGWNDMSLPYNNVTLSSSTLPSDDHFEAQHSVYSCLQPMEIHNPAPISQLGQMQAMQYGQGIHTMNGSEGHQSGAPFIMHDPPTATYPPGPDSCYMNPNAVLLPASQQVVSPGEVMGYAGSSATPALSSDMSNMSSPSSFSAGHCLSPAMQSVSPSLIMSTKTPGNPAIFSAQQDVPIHPLHALSDSTLSDAGLHLAVSSLQQLPAATPQTANVLVDSDQIGPRVEEILRNYFMLGEEGYKCLACKKSFNGRRTAARHWQEKHCAMRPYSCNICSKSYKRRDHAQRHLRNPGRRCASLQQQNTLSVVH